MLSLIINIKTGKLNEKMENAKCVCKIMEKMNRKNIHCLMLEHTDSFLKELKENPNNPTIEIYGWVICEVRTLKSAYNVLKKLNETTSFNYNWDVRNAYGSKWRGLRKEIDKLLNYA